MAIDFLAHKWNILVDKNKFDALIGEGRYEGEKVMLVKPQTYMNLSGEAVAQIMKFYKVQPEDLLVIYDDIDIPLGTLRIRPNGSGGTHNGMRNIISEIGTENFMRIRMGTDSPNHTELIDYVLSPFPEEEMATMQMVAKEVCEAVEETLKNGVRSAMNRFNRKKQRN